jgi:hypothetical protein
MYACMCVLKYRRIISSTRPQLKYKSKLLGNVSYAFVHSCCVDRQFLYCLTWWMVEFSKGPACAPAYLGDYCTALLEFS